MMSICIKIETSLSTDQDFLFTSIYSEVYTHFITADIQFVHLKNDSDRVIHIISKNDLEKITEMKKENCYLINENSHDLVILKSISKCKCSECSHSLTNTEENVTIFYNIRVHKNAESYCLDEIVNKHSNV